MIYNIKPNKFWQVTIILIGVLCTIYISDINVSLLLNKGSRSINIAYIILFLVNILSFYLLYFLLRLNLILKIDKNSISYKLTPWHKHFKDIIKRDIKILNINTYFNNIFHLGLTIGGGTVFNIANGECLYIETIKKKKYIISTGMNKEELQKVLKDYGYYSL